MSTSEARVDRWQSPTLPVCWTRLWDTEMLAGWRLVDAVTITRDVSQARAAFEAARSMIETSQDSLVALNPEGKITDVNEATVELTGIPRERLIGTSFSDYFTDPRKADEVYQRA